MEAKRYVEGLLLFCLCHTSVESVNSTSTEDAFFTSIERVRRTRYFDIDERVALTVDIDSFFCIESRSCYECISCGELLEADLSVLWMCIFFHRKMEKYDGIIKTLPEMQVFRLILTASHNNFLVCSHSILSTFLSCEEFCPFLSEWGIALYESC